MATTTVYPRLFEITITLTFRAGKDAVTVYPRWFEFLTTLTFRSRDGRLPTLV